MKCGSEMHLRSVPAMSGSRRKRIDEMQNIFLQLLVEGRFPRIWIPGAEMRDHRQLLIHRHKLVQIRTRVKNELPTLDVEPGNAEKAEAVE